MTDAMQRLAARGFRPIHIERSSDHAKPGSIILGVGPVFHAASAEPSSEGMRASVVDGSTRTGITR